MTGHSLTAMDKLVLMKTIIHALEIGTQLGTQNRIRKTKLQGKVLLKESTAQKRDENKSRSHRHGLSPVCYGVKETCQKAGLCRTQISLWSIEELVSEKQYLKGQKSKRVECGSGCRSETI